MDAVQPLPGYKHRSADPVKPMAPRLLKIEGQPTMIVHCKGVMTGLVSTDPEAHQNFDGQLMLNCYTPGYIGMMYLMTVDEARAMAASLNRLCDRQEANAKAAAAEALQKAATK